MEHLVQTEPEELLVLQEHLLPQALQEQMVQTVHQV
jgi:hypothetical protein